MLATKARTDFKLRQSYYQPQTKLYRIEAVRPYRTIRANIKVVKCQSNDSITDGLLSVLKEVRSTGTQLISKVAGTIKISNQSQRKPIPKSRDANTIFVAGATGRLGSRVVRELLSAGFKVRGGVRDQQKAQEFLDFSLQYELLTKEQAKRVDFVEYDLEIPDTIPQAIGKAAKVVYCAGAAESELSFDMPRRIDGDGAINLINAATECGVQQFVLVTSLGTTKFGFPIALFQIFGGILSQKARAERALQATTIPYSIIRPGGMERPTDKFKETHNVRLAPKDTLFGGLVSRLQIAELAVACITNPELAENKVLEVVAEEDAPKLSYDELLRGIESDETMADKLARLQEEERVQLESQEILEQIQYLQRSIEEGAIARSSLEVELSQLQQELAKYQKELGKAKSEMQQNKDQQETLSKKLEQQVVEIEIAESLLNAQKITLGEGRSLNEKEIEEVTQKVLGRQFVAKSPEMAGVSS
eukprot:TRINITY_DN1200_c0_g1_i2.p1 TRINITY_DN1200_c0_g1~~TRINITY_DN1200_c0_g1_i2.p1  ORF type:complete len:476 (-),score=56.17 TRINITY_DN1200_c0_g1_i2:245-1672(-)